MLKIGWKDDSVLFVEAEAAGEVSRLVEALERASQSLEDLPGWTYDAGIRESHAVYRRLLAGLRSWCLAEPAGTVFTMPAASLLGKTETPPTPGWLDTSKQIPGGSPDEVLMSAIVVVLGLAPQGLVGRQ